MESGEFRTLHCHGNNRLEVLAMSSFPNKGAHRVCLLLFRTSRRLFGLCSRGFREGNLCLAHPINILHELPIKPAQTTSHLAFLCGTLSGEG